MPWHDSILQRKWKSIDLDVKQKFAISNVANVASVFMYCRAYAYSGVTFYDAISRENHNVL